MKKGALFCLKGFIRKPKPTKKGKGTTGHPSSPNATPLPAGRFPQTPGAGSQQSIPKNGFLKIAQQLFRVRFEP